MIKTLRIRVEVPQKKGQLWKINAGNFGTVGRPRLRRSPALVYWLIERKLKTFLASKSDHQTQIWVQDGHYHNDGEYTDLKTAMYALTCFVEDHLTDDFKKSRFKKYYTGV